MPAVDPLPNNERLTQYGTDVFKGRPRPDHPGLSLCWGTQSVLAMVYAVTQRTQARERDRVRRTTVQSLRSAGFVVRHNPTQRNLFHVTVSYPGTWDETVAGRFNSCFDEPTRDWHD